MRRSRRRSKPSNRGAGCRSRNGSSRSFVSRPSWRNIFPGWPSLFHGKTARRPKKRAAGIQRGLEVVEYACALAGAHGRRVARGEQRGGLLHAPLPAGRGRGHHPLQLPGDGSDVDVSDGASPAEILFFSSRANKCQTRRCYLPNCCTRPACRMACSTSCRAIAKPSRPFSIIRS